MGFLDISHVTKSYGNVQVLHEVDIAVEEGEFLVLVGPSGCGKSTLLNMIAGLEAISSGDISIKGRVMNGVHPSRRNIAMVFQSYALYPNMTVGQNMTFGLEMHGVPKAEREKALADVGKLLQIDHLLDRKPGQLSGGQRQRVAMGRALVRNPDVFLFDEPLSNLDAKLRVDMRTEIKKLHQRVGKTTVYVTHDQIEAMTLASRIAVMHQGSVQQFDEPEVIYSRPANIFVAGFMGSPAMNFIDAELAEANGAMAVRFPLADGGSALLAIDRNVADRSKARRVVLGIRPEHLARQKPGDTLRPGFAALAAPVEVVEPTGAETMAVLRFGDKEIVGRFDPDDAPKTGESMPLAVDMTRACLFDPTTQRLI